jgi:hypothetical protein
MRTARLPSRRLGKPGCFWRDEEVIAAADKLGMARLFTGLVTSGIENLEELDGEGAGVNQNRQFAAAQESLSAFRGSPG